MKRENSNISSHKFNQIYQEMSLENQLPVIDRHLIPPEGNNYFSRISDAHMKIDNIMFKEASEIYIRMLEELKLENNAETRNNTIQELHKLYDKLNLYQNIVYFQQSLRKEEHNTMQEHIKNITENYNKLRSLNENDSRLMGLARENHKKYTEFLNNQGYMPKY